MSYRYLQHASTTTKMSLSKFGFMCVGKGTKTGDMETKNKKPKYDVYKQRQNEYEKRRVQSFQQPWGNECQWVRHTVMTNTNAALPRETAVSAKW